MRKLDEVIDKMIEVIPTQQQKFIDELKEVKEKVYYTAPEMMRNIWQEASLVIRDNMPASAKHFVYWQLKLVRVWLDQPKISIKELVDKYEGV